jgi:hypothetical protein
MLSKELLQIANGLLIDYCCTTVLTIKDRNGYSPDALTRYTPVTTLSNHIIDAIPAPGGNPLHFINSFKSILPEAIYRGKPLLSSPINQGVFTAPTMGILMQHLFFMIKPALPLNFFNNIFIAFPNCHPGKDPCLGKKPSLSVNQGQHRNIVLLTYLEVLDTVSRRGMHSTCTLF